MKFLAAMFFTLSAGWFVDQMGCAPDWRLAGLMASAFAVGMLAL